MAENIRSFPWKQFSGVIQMHENAIKTRNTKLRSSHYNFLNITYSKVLILLIICLIFLASCSKKVNNFAGIYNSERPNIIIRGFNYYFLNTIYSNRDQLVLNQDFTYSQTNFCMNWKGKWAATGKFFLHTIKI